jgi:Tfp pilus assembly protein FimT
VELIVVIAVITAFLAVALPNFRWGGLFQNRDPGIGSLAAFIESLKGRAVRENRDIFLNVDTAAGLAWISDTAMDAAALADARNNPVDIPENLFIRGVEFPGDDLQGHTDLHMIRFSKNGYSDLAILHVQGAGTPVSLKIEPFLDTVFTIFEPIFFHDCP